MCVLAVEENEAVGNMNITGVCTDVWLTVEADTENVQAGETTFGSIIYRVMSPGCSKEADLPAPMRRCC